MSARFDQRDLATLDAAIETWGREAQFDIASEEAAELILSIARFMRGRKEKDDITDEVADVMIMAEQLSLMLGRERVDARVDAKMARLRERLDDTNADDMRGVEEPWG